MRAFGVSLVMGSLLAACAPESDGQRPAEGSVAAEVEPPETVPADGSDGAGVDAEQAHPDAVQPPEVTEPPPESSGEEASGVSRCVPGPGSTGSPTSIAELMTLLDSLPKPTSVACLLQSLDRPLELYLTSSTFSAQPAPAPRSPRTFVVLGPLLLSVVAEGPASTLVEVGYRSAPGRSIKAEIPFPLRGAPTPGALLNRVRTGRVSMCAGCHTNELKVTDAFFDGGEDAFESDVIPPLYVFQLELEVLRAEAAACDPGLEPERCGILSALFDHGEVRQSELWSEQP
ncbi:MAG: hypothetical protein RL033_4038 [Pseudomonadota bacterium]